VVLASGSGTLLQSLLDDPDPKPYRIAAVGSDRSSCTALDRATFTICKNGQCATSVLEVAQSGSVATAECVQPANNPITCDVATSRDGAVVSVHYGLNTTTTDVGDVYTFTIQQPGVTSPVLSTTRIPQYTTSEPNGDGCGKVTAGTI